MLTKGNIIKKAWLESRNIILCLFVIIFTYVVSFMIASIIAGNNWREKNTYRETIDTSIAEPLLRYNSIGFNEDVYKWYTEDGTQRKIPAQSVTVVTIDDVQDTYVERTDKLNNTPLVFTPVESVMTNISNRLSKPGAENYASYVIHIPSDMIHQS